MTVQLHINDLPPGLDFGKSVAVDTETMGLNPHRDRLCLVQLSAGDGTAHLVHFPQAHYAAPNLKKLLGDNSVTKIFHFARFDVAMVQKHMNVLMTPVYCTRIASRLARTFSPRHGLKDLCRDILGLEISKQQQSSDWGAATLTPEQLEYAAADVLYLHRLRDHLHQMLVREGRDGLAQACFDFLPSRALLDLQGWPEEDIFSHSG